MSQAIVSPASCCSPCDESVNVSIPGPQGAPGTNGTNGTNGLNAFAVLTDAFTVPNAGTPDIAEVDNSEWATVGQIVFLEGAGYFSVVSIPDATHIELDNTDYPGNAADGTIIPIASHLSPGGIKGTDGSNGTGDMLGANNLSDVASPSMSLTNLGGSVVGVNLFTVASPSAIRFLRVNADNTVTLLSDSSQRTALGLAIGTNIQAFDAFLTAIAALGTAADKIIYTTGVNTAAESAITSLARTLLAQSTEALMRATLGKVLPRYGVLASKTAMDVNSAGSDNALTVEASRYRIDKVMFENASVNLTTATAGIFTAAGGGGTTIAADQALSALTASTKFKDLTLDAGIGTDVLTAGTIYARNGTAQSVAATVNVFVLGWRLD